MNMNEFNYMSAALELFAATVTAVMLVGCFLERKYRTKTGRFLVWVLIAHTAMLLVDAPIWILLANPKPENVIPIKILSFFSDAFLCALISLYAYCLTEYINERKKISYGYTNLITVLCGISLVLWLINAFNGMYIYYDATGLDHTGPHYLLSQAFNVVLPAMTMVLAFRYHDVIGWRNTWIWVLYGLIPVLSIPAQVLWAVTPVCIATTVSLVLVYTLIHVEQAEREANIEKELAQKELALSESNNSLVLSQIQPHFLYNTLDSIIWMSHAGRSEEVVEMTSALAALLRSSIGDGSDTNTLKTEIDHVRSYLTIQKMRYHTLHDEIDIDPQTEDCLLPKLVLQPLVENAIYHGIKVKQQGGTVRIESLLEEDRLLITVEDDGVGMTPEQLATILEKKEADGESSKIGVCNVNERLQLFFGSEAAMKYYSEPGKRTMVMLVLPIVREKGDADAEA